MGFKTRFHALAIRVGANHASRGGDLLSRFGLLPFLSSYLGGLAPFGIALGLAALGVRGRGVAVVVAAMLTGYVAVALFGFRLVVEDGRL